MEPQGPAHTNRGFEGGDVHARRLRSLVLVYVLVTTVGSGSYLNVSASAPPSGTLFDHVVVILMENQALSAIYGPGPYLTSLADNYSLAQHYSSTSHPSEGNYISLIGGSNFGHSLDGYCCYGITELNLIDRLENAGQTWEAYAEDAANSGTCAFTPPRNADHFPFKTFSDMNSTARCAHFQTTSSADQHEFIAALNSAFPPNYLWLTPIDSHNMHDNSVASGDAYLSALVPRILNSLTFTTKRGVLVITFDEGTGTTPNYLVYWVAAGPMANSAYKSNAAYTHYSLLRTLEDNWALATLQSNDAGATAMSEFFKNGIRPTPLPSNMILLLVAEIPNHLGSSPALRPLGSLRSQNRCTADSAFHHWGFKSFADRELQDYATRDYLPVIALEDTHQSRNSSLKIAWSEEGKRHSPHLARLNGEANGRLWLSQYPLFARFLGTIGSLLQVCSLLRWASGTPDRPRLSDDLSEITDTHSQDKPPAINKHNFCWQAGV